VSDAEAASLAAALGMATGAFVRRCLIWTGSGLCIRELPDGRCLFFEGGCRVYTHRPTQCRTWPFWFRNLRSLEHWESATKTCPGIGSGPCFSRDAILALLQAEMAHLPDGF
jgi:hypothetical protein